MRKARSSRLPPTRDMDESVFARILAELVARVPGAYSAALVDRGGETVDYAGLADPFDMRIAAAHLRILLQRCEEVPFWGTPETITVRGAKKSTLLRALPDGYALVLMMRKRAGFARAERAFLVCERALAREASWPASEGARSWVAVDVDCDVRGRPVSVSDGKRSFAVEVLGMVIGMAPGERAFRVRTEEGNEITLVREPAWFWYADEPPAGATSVRPV